jgi:hypothetical protein
MEACPAMFSNIISDDRNVVYLDIAEYQGGPSFRFGFTAGHIKKYGFVMTAITTAP